MTITADTRTVSIYALLDERRQIRYVGSSFNVKERVGHHWSYRNTEDRYGRNPRFCTWLRSLNERPEYEILQVVPSEERFAAEKHWTDLLRQVPGVELFNIASGSTPARESVEKAAASQRGKVVSAKTRAKIGEAGRGRTPANKGKPFSAETRAKISEALRGRQLSDEHKAKVSAARKGRPKSPEHVAKVAEALRGKPRSVETRAKLSAAGRGRVVSEETRAKISASQKGRPKRRTRSCAEQAQKEVES